HERGHRWERQRRRSGSRERCQCRLQRWREAGRRGRVRAAAAGCAERRSETKSRPQSGSHRGNAILSADVQDLRSIGRTRWGVTVRDTWNPTQYERFRTEREQPFHDLVALITRRPAGRVVDLGCGTGGLTALLHHEVSATSTLGVDSSEAMLDRTRALETPDVSFVRGDI